jgi:ADP-ribosylglycohydrolase
MSGEEDPSRAGADGTAGARADGSAEPDDLPGIRAAADPGRPRGRIGDLTPAEAERRARAAFLSRVCGCMLGKPVEGCADPARLCAACQRTGEWPLRDYLTAETLDALGERHPSWTDAVRGRFDGAAPDDDVNYTILAMTVLEEKGTGFTRDDLRRAWLANLAPGWTWGPERTFLAAAAAASVGLPDGNADVGDEAMAAWVGGPEVECCGALIRADAYGYACMGSPELAAELAWRDAGMSHRRTGVYGAMVAAAAIAAAPVSRSPLEAFTTALGFVPRGSRFHAAVSDCISIVSDARDWESAYAVIHERYGAYGFCGVIQECGTLANTLRFARGVGDGICIQVMQGNDTDSFGATAGSILGAWFGPDGLEPRWLAPFGGRIRTALASFHEQRLDAVADRMARLPRLTAG